ncbi:MAG: S8 family serine peptidase [Casimicrobiaceae bacterium]
MVFFRLIVLVAATLVGGALPVSPSAAQTLVDTVDVSSLAVPPEIAATERAGLVGGDVQIIVRLTDPPLAVVLGPHAKRVGARLSEDQQRAYVQQLHAKQDALMAQIRALGGVELARFSKAHNAIAVQVNAQRVVEISRLSGVAKIRPVINYELGLSETVPYIGATQLQIAGIDGTGVRVAVLDSGIDYTHRNLGGEGTLAAYSAAYGAAPAAPENKSRDGLFPTAKVVDGFDFVGEVWPFGPLQPDPDPIDFQGHGTHVADIIAGQSLDGEHKGVAPGAKLLIAKVCSAVSTSCSGIALLQGMDFALDPNGDGALSDAVDVVNMSLGSSYGQREDDLSEASANASRFGVVVVASAGNSADRPYIVGSPSTTPDVISVAQTQVPSAAAFPLRINAPPAIAGLYTNTATLDFAPITSEVTGDVAFVGRGCPANSIAAGSPEDPYIAPPAGKVALIDRGACSVSLKIDRAAKAGALAVLIGLVAPGDAISFSYGGGDTFVPSLVITQPTSNLIKANLAAPVNVTLSPFITVPLAGSVVNSSSRGPGYSYVSIKPDIGAPGGSLSAQARTGTGETAFGGTSGAAPMVAGSAALLLSADSTLSPVEVKAKLMNSAETNILTNPALQPGALAPITRIGSGEVRVDRAAALTSAAWDAVDPASVGLSFGYNAATGRQVLRKKVHVRNYAASARTFSIAPSFRFADDAASGAVTFSAPPTVAVAANGSAVFTLTMLIDAAKLPTWTLNGGLRGGNGPLLQSHEFDGYLAIADDTDSLHLPWHLLPHKAAAVKAATTAVALNGSEGSVTLTNPTGAVDGRVDVFSLTGSNGRLAAASLPQPGDNFAIIDLKAVGVRAVSLGGGQFGVQFGINTWGGRSHPVYPAEFDIFIDSNNDGVDDFVVFNSELGAFASSGQTVINVFNLATNTALPPRFFADASLNSANMIMTVALSDLGLTLGTTFRFSVLAGDNYFTGAITDDIVDMVYTLDTPKYFASSTVVPVGGSVPLPIEAIPGGEAASPSQTGILLLYRDAKPGAEAELITVTP